MAIRKTHEQWLKEAKEIHGDLYDYSRTIYKNRGGWVVIICRQCGQIIVIAGNHVNKKRPAGCDTCKRKAAASALTKPFSDMLKAAREKHGNFYEYDDSTYKSALVKMRVICPNHGDFWIKPDSHVRAGQGCFECGKLKILQNTKARRFAKVSKIIRKHSDGKVQLYYNLFHGQNFNAKFKCEIHGEFSRKPIQAMATRHPCPQCLNLLPNRNTKLTHEVILERVRGLKGNVEVITIKGEGKQTRVTLRCLKNQKHGIFEKTPETLYGRDFICPKCAHSAAQDQRTSSIREIQDNKREGRYLDWLQRAEAFHQGKFDYSEVEYYDAVTPVLIGCPKHGLFPQTPHVHLTKGCRKCADEDLKGRYTYTYFERYPSERDAIARLYHIEINAFEQTLFKIGITKTDIKQRFSSAIGKGFKIRVLAVKEMRLFGAFKAEQDILSQFRNNAVDTLSDDECDALRDASIGVTELIDRRLNEQLIDKYFN